MKSNACPRLECVYKSKEMPKLLESTLLGIWCLPMILKAAKPVHDWWKLPQTMCCCVCWKAQLRWIETMAAWKCVGCVCCDELIGPMGKNMLRGVLPHVCVVWNGANVCVMWWWGVMCAWWCWTMHAAWMCGVCACDAGAKKLCVWWMWWCICADVDACVLTAWTVKLMIAVRWWQMEWMVEN